MVKVELFLRFFPLSKLFSLNEVSLSVSRLSELTIEMNNRKNLECFSINLWTSVIFLMRLPGRAQGVRIIVLGKKKKSFLFLLISWHDTKIVFVVTFVLAYYFSKQVHGNHGNFSPKWYKIAFLPSHTAHSKHSVDMNGITSNSESLTERLVPFILQVLNWKKPLP